LGGAKVLDLEDQGKVAAVVIPRRSQNLLEEGCFCSNFRGWRDLVFAEGFAKTGGWMWFFDGEVAVDCW
jgi:hypothetical protein